MIVFGIVTLIISWWLAPWIIKLLFERGEFPALALVSLLASHGKHNLVAVSGKPNLFVKTGASYVLVPIMGINGIMIATGILFMVSFFQLY